jgi:hypothetical protein
VLYPGFLIESQDAEEAAYFCGCRAASANHPCPKCLISHSDLHDITGTFAELRTPETMQAVIALASKVKTKGQREEILKDKGLHNVEVSQTKKTVSVRALITAVALQSTFFGILGFQIHTGLTHMIPYILTTWESGESIFGSFFWQFWRNHVAREILRNGRFLQLSRPRVRLSGNKDSESCHLLEWQNFLDGAA